MSLGNALGQSILSTRKATPSFFDMDDVNDMLTQDRWPVPGDPFIANVGFLVHGNQTLQNNVPVVAVGNLSSLTCNFQSGIAAVSGSNDLLDTGTPLFTTPTSSFRSLGNGGGLLVGFNNITLGSQDFVIDILTWLGSASGGGSSGQVLVDGRPFNTNGNFPTISTDASGKPIYVTASTTRITGAAAVTASTSLLFTYARISGVGTLAVNGASVGSWADTTVYGIMGAMRFGCPSFLASPRMATGSWYDECRFTVGSGRGLTFPFTPPTTRFPDC